MNHEGKRPANDLYFMIYDSLFDILRFFQRVRSPRCTGMSGKESVDGYGDDYV